MRLLSGMGAFSRNFYNHTKVSDRYSTKRHYPEMQWSEGLGEESEAERMRRLGKR